MFKKLLIGLCIVAAFSGCLKSSSSGSYTQTCTYDACAVKAPDSEITAIQNYLSANNITAVQHCSGMFYKIDTLGTGAAPTACSYVGVRYKGYFMNGQVFDQQTSTINFALGQTIRGWANGVPLIKQGGVIHLYIPPALGYGYQDVLNPQTGAVAVPKNSYLIFDVHLDAVQ